VIAVTVIQWAYLQQNECHRMAAAEHGVYFF
jgi:hypothetical protein